MKLGEGVLEEHVEIGRKKFEVYMIIYHCIFVYKLKKIALYICVCVHMCVRVCACMHIHASQHRRESQRATFEG